MKHRFEEIELLSMFRFGDTSFEKHSESQAREWPDGPLVSFHSLDYVDIISGQTRLKAGSPLYDETGKVIARFSAATRAPGET